MPSQELEEFAKVLVEQIRDTAIQECDRSHEGSSPVAKRWREVFEQGSQATARAVIPDCVDETIFRLLHAIDEGAIRLQLVTESGKVVDLTKDGQGELAGWYMGTGGWRDQYSEERFVDDLADLELD